MESTGVDCESEFYSFHLVRIFSHCEKCDNGKQTTDSNRERVISHTLDTNEF